MKLLLKSTLESCNLIPETSRDGNTLDMIAKAWKNVPHRFLNLCDMIKFVGEELISVLSKLHRHQEQAALMVAHCGRTSDANDVERNELDDFLVNIVSPLCRKLSLVEADGRCLGLAHNLVEVSLFPHLSHAVLEHDLSELRKAIMLELGSRHFAFISPSKVEFFEQNALFGNTVNRAFPDAVFDIKEAGNCIAADLNTAAVFHLVRVLEHGLRALAKRLKVRTVKRKVPIEFGTWEEILTSLSKKTEALKPKIRGKRKQSALDLYNGMLLELNAVKDFWRNQVMHTRATYDEHQAASALVHVRQFMKTLAPQILPA